MGCIVFGDGDRKDVCHLARFDDVVKQLLNGLETDIQEKGVNLSGGRRQRLALARGFLAVRMSDIVRLDEPTSRVDPKTELAIYRELLREFADEATVSTLHRLHLLPFFEYIYIMRDGKIEDEGRKAALR
ncbi:hypothetical protein BH09BAC4_BH09BAC4_37500 [soil metagenome]